MRNFLIRNSWLPQAAIGALMLFTCTGGIEFTDRNLSLAFACIAMITAFALYRDHLVARDARAKMAQRYNLSIDNQETMKSLCSGYGFFDEHVIRRVVKRLVRDKYLDELEVDGRKVYVLGPKGLKKVPHW